MRRVRSILLPVAVIVALALTVTMAGSVFAGGRPLSAELTGAAEVPPASPTGGGHVELTVNPGTGEICYSLTVSAAELMMRALYAQFEQADTIEERQAIWDAIVAHKRAREPRVGGDSTQARDAVVEQHRRRRLWPF